MLATLSLIFLAITFVVSEYDGTIDPGLPNYIKTALREKNQYRPFPKQKKKTLGNLTLIEVIDKIKDITRALDNDAKLNGYKVDYKFRILNI